jgi:hypothetical protein
VHSVAHASRYIIAVRLLVLHERSKYCVHYSLVMHFLVRTSTPSCVSLHVLVIVSTARMTVSMLAFVLIDCCNWCMCLSLSDRDRRMFTRRFMAQSQLDTRKPFCTAAVTLWTVTGSCLQHQQTKCATSSNTNTSSCSTNTADAPTLDALCKSSLQCIVSAEL